MDPSAIGRALLADSGFVATETTQGDSDLALLHSVLTTVLAFAGSIKGDPDFAADIMAEADGVRRLMARMDTALATPPRPAAVAEADVQITEDVAIALSDLQRASQSVGELAFRPGQKRAEEEEADARAECEREIIDSIRTHVRLALATRHTTEGDRDA